jgi:transposase
MVWAAEAPGVSRTTVETFRTVSSAGRLAGAKEVAATDAFRGYASPVSVGLPKVTVVVDWLRAVALAKRCVDRARRRVKTQTLGHRRRAAVSRLCPQATMSAGPAVASVRPRATHAWRSAV